jgi:hypothetical protein
MASLNRFALWGRVVFSGQLFTSYFLSDGIRETGAWNALPDDVLNNFRSSLVEIFLHFPLAGSPHESQTEQDLFFPVLQVLGWDHILTQTTASPKGRTDVPDVLLFATADDKAKANAEEVPAHKFRHGLAICESKAWQLPLDRASGTKRGLEGVPSTQILRYLSVAEIQSNRCILWGMLTNGRHWRLYYQQARSRSEQFLELDLPVILGLPGFEDLFLSDETRRDHWLKVFWLMFGREAFLESGVPSRTFHELALNEGRLWEERVSQDLSELVFHSVFRELIEALAANDPQAPNPLTEPYLSEAKEEALILLYRLLFVLYAEDRNLLPVNDKGYDDYGLRRRVRQDIKDRMDRADVFSGRVGFYYNTARELFGIIDHGDPSIGLTPYNGGLFDAARTPILERTVIPDNTFAPLIDILSRGGDRNEKRWINYRDLSVQQLGSIYERLLEHEPILDDGRIVIRPNVFARKGSGSYYTPEELVRLIVRRTVGPLVEERRRAFKDKVEQLAGDRRSKKKRLKELTDHDPATAILELRICDPAMGSGHFLVSLVDFLADAILEAMAEAEVDWADEETPYLSPLAERIEALRRHIQTQAKARGWVVSRDQLDDRLLVRRIILKRVVHGVDLNPMAVELAKVSLWLHTFTVGAPLSFLDHHLRCGDSLFGEWVFPVEKELSARFGLVIGGHIQRAKQAAKDMRRIEDLSDIDIGEVKESVSAFDEVRQGTEPLRRVLDLRQALRWLGLNDLSTSRLPQAIAYMFDGAAGDLVTAMTEGSAGDDGRAPELTIYRLKDGTPPIKDFEADAARILGRSREIAAKKRFLHWQVAFPDIWPDWAGDRTRGGFDAVIGNPPWDRIKLQEVEWFAARRPEIAAAQTAAERKRLIKRLYKPNDPLVADYEQARWAAETAAQVARRQGEYPLLSRGDINLYCLFVERAMALIKPEGMVGLLTPSGIASDKGASAFFRSISTTARLSSLIDFENRGVFFPDVHRSFKFCVFVAGGPDKKFDRADCAFFLHSTEELEDPERAFSLTARDFDQINPNTGTAPVFRTRRDAEITKDIYSRVPVLVDRRGEGPRSVWPVRYYTMFHMTNDSHLFRTTEQLRADGCYPVAGNRWKKGDDEYVPLYVGRMINQYDHRASSVSVNVENIHNPALSALTTIAQHQEPDFCPEPQFWVPENEVDWPQELKWTIGFRDIARVTDVRTVISTIIPLAGMGNTLPLILQSKGNLQEYKEVSPLLLANLNSMIADYVARQKVQSTHLNWYIVEQLPIVAPVNYSRTIGSLSARQIVFQEVLRLVYTSNDIEPFATDMGYDGPPFPWDEEERRNSRARLDALYFLLYGLDRTEAAYVLDTFPIVREQDENQFGRYRTKDLILGYMAAFAAGDPESRVSA